MPSPEQLPAMARSPEALLEVVRRRARRLRRRRRLVAMVPLVAILAAGGVALASITTEKRPIVVATAGKTTSTTRLSGTSSSSNVATSRPGFPPTTKPPTTLETCRVAHVQVVFAIGQASAGRGYGQFTVRNISAMPCTVAGYPTVVLLDDKGRPLPTTLTHADPTFPRVTNQPVTLAPAALADFNVTWIEYRGLGTCATPPTAASLRITLPGASHSMAISARSTNGMVIQACGGNLSVSFLYPHS